MVENKSNLPSFSIRNGYVYIWVPKLKKSVVVGKIEGSGKYVWEGASEPDHTIKVNGKRCFGIDKGLLIKYLLPRQMLIEIHNRVGDVYSISAKDAHEHGIDRQFSGYGRQYYIPMERFLLNSKPFNEA